jgi:hypothetical protein
MPMVIKRHIFVGMGTIRTTSPFPVCFIHLPAINEKRNQPEKQQHGNTAKEEHHWTPPE